MFWNLPLSFNKIPSPSPLAERLSRHAVTLVKGDANYRRLVGDCDWPQETPFAAVTGYWASVMTRAQVAQLGEAEAARGVTNSPHQQQQQQQQQYLHRVCALRTLKSEVVCGVSSEVVTIVEQKDATWKVSGKWGVVHFQ